MIISLLLGYLNYSLTHSAFYFESLVQALRYLLMVSYMIFFLPFYEIFISIFRCEEDGYHYIGKLVTLFYFRNEYLEIQDSLSNF